MAVLLDRLTPDKDDQAHGASAGPRLQLPTVSTCRSLAISRVHAQVAGIEDMDAKIIDAVKHAPEWVRHDLLSNDRLVRMRAEETLAAMISSALRLKAA